jgi:hypothetical protein
VKSCISTRLGVNEISSLGGAFAFQRAIFSTSAAVSGFSDWAGPPPCASTSAFVVTCTSVLV